MAQASPEIEVDNVFSDAPQQEVPSDLFSLGVPSAIPSYSPEAKSELSTLLGPVMDLPKEHIKAMADQDPEFINTGMAQFQGKLNSDRTQALREVVVNGTPEQAATALKEFNDTRDTTPTVVDLREAYVRDTVSPEKVLQADSVESVPLDEDYVPVDIPAPPKDESAPEDVPFETLGGISRQVYQSAVISEELQKATSEFWDRTPRSKAAGDLLELITPFVGLGVEEYNKYSRDYASYFERLRSTGNREEARQEIQAIIEDIREMQTDLMFDNNSLMTVQALNYMLEEFENGTMGYVDGTVTEAELGQIAESVAFTTLEAAPVIGPAIGKLSGLGKMMSRVLGGIAPRRVDTLDTGFVFTGTPADVEIAKNFRDGTNVLDSVSSADPLNVVQAVREENLASTLDNFGMSADDAAERSLPSLEAGDSRALPDEELTIPRLNELLFVQGGREQVEAGLVRSFNKALGNDASADLSSVVWKTEPSEDSFGTFEVMIKRADGTPFEGDQEAQLVKERMFGVDSEIIEQTPGSWVIKVTQRHTFNPFRDIDQAAVASDGATFRQWMLDTGFNSVFLDPMRALTSEVLEVPSTLTDVNRQLVTNLGKRFNQTVQGLSEKDLGDLGAVMQRGEQLGAEGRDLTRDDILEVLPHRSTDRDFIAKVQKAYSEMQEISDAVYEITDKSFRNGLESRGFKTWRVPENLGLENDMAYVREVNPVELGELRDLAQRNGETIRVLDSFDGSVEDLRNIQQIGEDKTLVRTIDSFTDRNGEEFDIVIVRNEDTGSLPSGPLLNKRKGYIPKYYSETGWIVTRNTSRQVNGVTSQRNSVRGIVKTRKEAQVLRKQMIENEVREFSKTLQGTPEERKQLVRAKRNELNAEFPKPTRSRENSERDISYAKNGEYNLGFGSWHTKTRGTGLLGAGAESAPVINPISAMARRVNRMESELNKPMIRAMQAKFIKKFRNLLQNGNFTAWSDNLDDMVNSRVLNQSDSPAKLKAQMEAYHKYVKSLRQIREADTLTRFLDDVFNELLGEVPMLNNIASKGFALLRRIATEVFITSRLLFQGFTNLFQIQFIAARYPEESMQIAMKGMAAAVPLIVSRARGITDYGSIGRMLGTDAKTAKQAMNFLFEESGLLDAKFADDILSEASGKFAEEVAMGSPLKSALKGVQSAVSAPLRASKFLQSKTIELNNMLAFLAEFRRQVVTEGRDFSVPAVRKDILFRSRQLTFTQNKANKFQYQNAEGVIATMMQFSQHVHKMFLDLVVDPAVAAASFGKAKTQSIWSESPRAAWGVTLYNMAMFGTTSFLGGGLATQLRNWAVEEHPELQENPEYERIFNILSGGVTNMMLPGLTGRITPGAFADNMLRFGDVANTNVLELIFGASGAATNSMLDAMYGLYVVNFLTEEISGEDQFFASLNTMARVFAGANDLEKAYIAYNMMHVPYGRSLTGVARADLGDAVASAFSIPNIQTQDFFLELRQTEGLGGKTRSSFNKINDYFVREMNLEMTALQASGQYTLPEAFRILNKWASYAKSAHGADGDRNQKVYDYFASKVIHPGEPTYEQFIKPYLNHDSAEEVMQNLRRLANDEQLDPGARALAESELRLAQAINALGDN